MITFKRAKEIFSDKNLFLEIKEENFGNKVDMKNVTKSGVHYRFHFRLRPNGVNDCAEIVFAKWTTMRAYCVCEIYDEQFLQNIIFLCKQEML